MTGWVGAADPRFFSRGAPLPLAAIAAAVGAVYDGPPRSITGVAPLQTATADQVSFLDNKRYLPDLAQTHAGVVIVHTDMAGKVPEGCVALACKEPYLGWARACALFHPPAPLRPGVHPSAIIAPSVRIDPSVEIGPHVVIGEGAEIGLRCRIAAGVVIDAGVVLGDDCRIGANASLSHAIIGARVYVYPGARIGQEGFGFATGPRGFETVPQLGRVLIGDDVEVGANSCIDRGAWDDTVIGENTKIDNLVQIGHNVSIGRHCIVVAHTGISGSSTLEDYVVLGARVGINNDVTVGEGAQIAAISNVNGNVPPGARWGGTPAKPIKQWFREIMAIERLARAKDGAASAPNE